MLVAVAGATGSIGGRVVRLLLDSEREGMTVVALSRNGRYLYDDCQQHLIHRQAQYEDEASLRAALAGVDTLVFPGSDGDPEQMLQHHRNVIAAALWCKVRRIVYLSALDTDKDSRFPYAQVHQATEKLLEASDLQRCVLRASIFAEFFLDSFVGPALSTGVMQIPGEGGRVSFVSKSDVAAAIAGAVFIEPGSGVFNLTGSEALGLEDVVRIVHEVTGRWLRYEPISEETYRSQLIEKGVELCYVEAFATMFSYSITAGNFELVSNDVAYLSESIPQVFSDCLVLWWNSREKAT